MEFIQAVIIYISEFDTDDVLAGHSNRSKYEMQVVLISQNHKLKKLNSFILKDFGEQDVQKDLIKNIRKTRLIKNKAFPAFLGLIFDKRLQRNDLTPEINARTISLRNLM